MLNVKDLALTLSLEGAFGAAADETLVTPSDSLDASGSEAAASTEASAVASFALGSAAVAGGP